MITNSRFKTVAILAASYSFIMVSLSIFIFIKYGYGNLSANSLMNVTQDMFCIVLGFVLFICSVIDTPRKDRDYNYFHLMLLVNIVSSFVDEVAWLVDGHPEYIQINYAANSIYYIANILMAYFFWKYVTSFLHIAGEKLGIWPLLFGGGAVLSIVIIILNLFTGFYFTVGSDGLYRRSPLFWVSNIYIYVSMVLTLVLVVLARKRLKRYQIVILFMYVLAPLITGLFSALTYGITLTNSTVITVLVLMYCVLNVIQNRERVVAESELATATAIQVNILPNIFPPYPDKTEFDLYASMVPAREVGGDLYDYFLVDEDHLAIIIADVSGKGVPAALFMMVVKTLLKNQSLNGSQKTSDIFYKVNNQLCEGNDLDMFATAWLGIIELSTGKLTYATAGHEYMALKKKDGKFNIVKVRNSPPLAVMEHIKYNEYEEQLEAGDTIWLYTDGVPEATNSTGEMFGIGRMIDSLNAHNNDSMKELDTNVRADIAEFTEGADQFDDITTLCVRYNGPAK